METFNDTPRETVAAPSPGRFRWSQAVVWLPAAAIAGVLIAWFAEVAQEYYAPLVVFPIVVGIVLAGACVALMRSLDVGHRPTIIAGGLLAVALTVVGEHYIAYLQAQRQTERQADQDPKKRLLMQMDAPDLFPPKDFLGYLRWRAERGRPMAGGFQAEGALAWASWGVDALLILAPTMILLVATARLPYCDRCRSWYHTIRSGKIDNTTAHRLAAIAGAAIPPKAHSAHYRLTACDAGCGPSGLALAWEQPEGDFSSGYRWLDAARRNEAVEVLDQQPKSEG